MKNHELFCKKLLRNPIEFAIISRHYARERTGDPVAQAGSGRVEALGGNNKLKEEIPQMAVVSMKQLLEAGVHFGHQTRRWNPKMAEYINMERNGIYIIDLQMTVKKLEDAYSFVRSLAENGQPARDPFPRFCFWRGGQTFRRWLCVARQFPPSSRFPSEGHQRKIPT